MTTLGQAYVQIMPSAKGISGSIQKTLNPEASAAGKSAGKNIASAMADSMSKAGSALSKSITAPALAATSAIGGLVGVLGWKRLTGLDAARSQLQGLGYDAQAVDRISSTVQDSVQGTVMTMAEGVSTAAGALAAGVKEGAELEKYIKAVGDAAAGSGRDVGDMAQIFNRVQGSGRLMTQEMNMIEDGMPGFVRAMSDSLGVPMEEFRKMVTEGEVSSEQFLDVMDSFAGDMSEAYANSWAGMVANTKSNIGIIGQNLLGGVFEQSKESIGEFLEYLRSDSVKEWASGVGQSIGDTFSKVVETIKSTIQWWTNLDGSARNLILTVSGIAVAIGPVLMAAGKLITTAIALSDWFGELKAGAKIVGAALGGISTPVLVVTGVIAGLIAIFAALYKSNEGFRDLVNSAWAVIKNSITSAVQVVSDFVMDIFGGLVAWWNENNQLIRETARVVWQAIQNVIMTVVNALVPHIQSAWSIIQKVTSTVWTIIKNLIQAVLGTILGIIKAVMQAITGDWRGAWDTVKNTVKNAFENVKNIIKSGMKLAYEMVTGYFGRFKQAGKNIVTSIADGIKGAIGTVTNAIGNVASKIRDFLPFSPAEVGPLKDLDKLNFGGTISMGIEDGTSEVQKAMNNMLASVFNSNSQRAYRHNGEVENQGHVNANKDYINVHINLDGRQVATVLAEPMEQVNERRTIGQLRARGYSF